MDNSKSINVQTVKSYKKYVAFAGAMAGLLFGLDCGVMGGALPFVASDLQLDSHLQEYVVSAMMLGAAIGAIATNKISASLGRKKSLFWGAVLFCVGSLGCAFSPNVDLLIVSRLILGFSIGITSYTGPLYLAEMSEKETRGRLIAMYQLMCTFGILVAYLSDTYFSFDANWRMMLGIVSIPAFILIALVIRLPESPRWLATKGNFEQAEKVLYNLRETQSEVVNEIKEIKDSLKIKQAGWSLFKSNKNVRRAVFLGMLLMLMQQFTGMNIIFYYAPTVFGLAGFTSSLDQMIFTVLCGVVNLFSTIIAMRFVDRLGRKIILKVGFAIIAVSMVIIGVCIYAITNELNYAWVPFTAVIIIFICIMGYAMSAAPIMWTICSEIQPLKSREFGIACSTATCWISSTILGATFLTLVNTLGGAQTFWLYAVLNILFIGITIWLIPETKGISLENIEKKLMEGKSLRHIGL